MKRNRRSVAIVTIVAGAILAFAAFQIISFRRAFGVKDQRVVQILASSDGRTRAELIHRHALFDLNFIIQLNGAKIFTSPDFKPNNTIPFRETILWDKAGKNLIFEVGGHRLFGYNLTAKRQLSDQQLLALEVQNPKPQDFHYSGHWPGLPNKSH